MQWASAPLVAVCLLLAVTASLSWAGDQVRAEDEDGLNTCVRNVP